MTKQQALSAMILAQMAEGKPVIEAMKEVLGSDLVDYFIDDLYESLRRK